MRLSLGADRKDDPVSLTPLLVLQLQIASYCFPLLFKEANIVGLCHQRFRPLYDGVLAKSFHSGFDCRFRFAQDLHLEIMELLLIP